MNPKAHKNLLSMCLRGGMTKGQVYKPFFFVNWGFVPGKPLHPSLMFVGKANVYGDRLICWSGEYQCCCHHFCPTSLPLSDANLLCSSESGQESNLQFRRSTHLGYHTEWSGSAISNGREPKSCLGQVFNSKLDHIAILCSKGMAWHAATSRVENSAQGSSCQFKFVHGNDISNCTSL